MDYKILVGIAGAESTFETAGNTSDNNAWGLGCFDNSPCWHFESLPDGIRALAKTLTHNRAYSEFQQSGKIEDIATRYLSGDKGRWTRAVNYFAKEVEATQ